MSHISGNPTATDKLVYRLRLMADAGGMISRDRRKTIIEAADRLEEFSDTLEAIERKRGETNEIS